MKRFLPLGDIERMLDSCAPGYVIKPGTHCYTVHYAAKHFPLAKGEGGSTGSLTGRSKVEIRIKKVAAMVAHFGICFKCAQDWFPDLSLPGDKAGEEVKSYCSEHKAQAT